MSQPFDPVFSNWYTDKRLGIGTDGRVYSIVRKNENGEEEKSILKTIRIGINRNEDKGFNSINEKTGLTPNEENYNKIIKSITDNISVIQEKDNGKRFVRYEEWEVRDTSDAKGKLLMIRLEEMRSLTDVLSRFSFTLEETVALGISICKSLKRCRDFGYVYPNLKPENILFDENGVCKLGDFGSFSILEPSKSSIAYKRTQYYMAPELIETGKINATSDTYSLGLVLYTLVNRGRLPFAEMYPQEVTLYGLNRSVENRVNALPLPKPKYANDALFAVISKACAFKPQDRYLTPGQMLADLKNVLNNEPFEKTQYEDIFSNSQSLKEEDTAFEKNAPQESVHAQVKEKKEESVSAIGKKTEKKPQTSLRDEIKIPNVMPVDYSRGRRAAPKRKAVLPISQVANDKKIVWSSYSPEIKKIIIILIAIIIAAIMLVISLNLRQSYNNETENESTSGSSSEVNDIGSSDN